MSRTQGNEPSNPISRAFSKFFERGRVGDKDEATPARTATQASPRTASAQRPATTATTARPVQAATPSATAGLQTAASTTARPAVPPTTATPTATPTTTRRTHTVASGDTLSAIAKKVYGRADRWNLIFEANRDKLDNPDRIYPGQVLVIPDAPSLH